MPGKTSETPVLTKAGASLENAKGVSVEDYTRVCRFKLSDQAAAQLGHRGMFA